MFVCQKDSQALENAQETDYTCAECTNCKED